MHGYGSLSFFSILWFFVWVLWVFLLVRILSDVFRSADLTGAGKASWTLLLVVFPFVGVLLYLVFRGSDMHLRENQHAAWNQRAFQHLFQPGSAEPASVADEIGKLAALRDRGLLTEHEYAAEKARVIGSAGATR